MKTKPWKTARPVSGGVLCASAGTTSRLATLSLVALMTLLAPSVRAATISVNSTADVVNEDDGQCTLREAILAATLDTEVGFTDNECVAGSPGSDTIDFTGAGASGTITLTLGVLTVPSSLVISGPGAGVLAISGNDATALIDVTSATELLDVTISGLTLRDGSSVDGVGVHAHGENVTLDAVVVSENVASGSGGAVATDSGSTATLTVRDSTFVRNTAVTAGGAIWARGNVVIERSTFTENTLAGGNGGAINIGGTAVLENVTISGNRGGAGGGIYVDASNVELEIRHSTIAANTADESTGGNLYVTDSLGAGIVTIDNSIVADGVSNSDDGSDLHTVAGSGTITLRYTLLESPGPATFVSGPGVIIGQDPQLAALANQGGLTLTMKPAATSPVVDAGDPAFAPPPTTDQRGIPRLSGPRVDMGAVELQNGTLQFSVAAADVAESAGTYTATVTRTDGTDGPASIQVNAGAGGSATGSGVDYTFAGTILNWFDGDGASKTFDVTIHNDLLFEGPETIDLELSAATGASIGSPSTQTVTILDDDLPPSPVADLSIAKSIVTPGPYSVGQQITFSITVTNAGPDAATAVTLSDTLPVGMSLVSASSSQGTCSGNATVTCALGALASGGNATVTLLVQLGASGSFSNTASVASPDDLATGNNSGTASLTVDAIPVEAVAPIPTLGESMQLLLAALVAAVAMAMLSRR